MFRKEGAPLLRYDASTTRCAPTTRSEKRVLCYYCAPFESASLAIVSIDPTSAGAAALTSATTIAAWNSLNVAALPSIRAQTRSATTSV